MKLLRRFLGGLLRRWRQRYFWASRWFGAGVPVHNLSWLPDHFTIERLGETGVGLVDQFCTAEECDGLIATLRQQLEQGAGDCYINSVRRTKSYSVSGRGNDDPALLPLLYRAATLLGVPYTAVTEILIGRVRGDASAGAFPQADSHAGGRHVVRIYLNAVGDSVFPRLKLGVTPLAGRALYWSVRSAEDAGQLELHESVAVGSDQHKLFIQLRFGDDALGPDVYGGLNPPQARQGLALTGAEVLPAGAFAPQRIDLEEVFGQPDKMEGLL